MTAARDVLRRSLLALSVLGLLVFGGGWVTSLVAPLAVEQAAREVLRIEVERRVGERLDALSDSRLAGLARKALQKTTADADRIEQALRERLPQRVASAVADLLNADCECRKRLAALAKEAHEEQLGVLRNAQARLADWIEQAYAQTRERLLREFRIVTGVNAALFAALGLVGLWQRQSTVQLALAAATLLGACAIVGSLYLLRQDWLHTLVFNDYVGWSYAGYLAGVSALLADIAFNQAKVTTTLINAAFQAVGSASPC